MRSTWSAMAIILVGCGSSAHNGTDAGAGIDAGVDAMADAGTGTDAMPDAGSALPCARVGYPTPPVIDQVPGVVGMRLGDWNNDGKIDLAAPDGANPALRIWLNNGDGTFLRVANVALQVPGGRPIAFDANGDGKLDLALKQGDSSVGVLLGNGDGTFGAQQNFATGPLPFFLAAGDFNNDGVPDLVTSNLDDMSISLLLGLGDGTFGAHHDTPTHEDLIGPLVAAELTGDSKLDVATTAKNDERILVLRGDGAGGLAIETDFRTGILPFDLAVTDMNGDGANDIVAIDFDQHDVVVAKGDGHGGFAVNTSVEVDFSPAGLAVGDLDGDGRPDVVIGAAFDGKIDIMRNDGNGLLLPPTSRFIGNTAGQLALADVDRDGKLDLLASDGNEGPVVLRGNGDGSVVAAPSYDTGFMLITAAGDLDGDGQPDVVGAAPPGNGASASVSRGLADGSFAAPQVLPLDDNPTAIAIGDLNGDGIGDLVIGRSASQQLGVQLGDASAGFRASINTPAGAKPSAIALGDFDGDGRLDAAVADLAGNHVQILLGNGDGSFGAPISVLAGGVQRSIAAGDLDHDGYLDLVVQLDGVGEVSVLHGHGDGTFDDGLEYLTSSATGALARDLRLADLDHDGRLDVIVFNTLAAGNTLAVLRGKADGTLAAPIESPAAILVAAISPDLSAPILGVGDLDRDGQLDVVVTSGSSAAIAILYGRGDATFRPRVDYKVGAGPNTPIIADVDHDGIPDIVTYNAGLQVLQVLKGTCL